jgi:hypothetical protein
MQLDDELRDAQGLPPLCSQAPPLPAPGYTTHQRSQKRITGRLRY